MRRLDINIPVSEENEEEKKRLIYELNDNPLVIDLLNRYHLSFEVLKESPYRIDAWQKRKQKCINCLGLKNCKQDTIGEIVELGYDNGFYDILTPCSFKKELAIKNKHITNYVVKHFPDSYNNVSIMDCDVDSDILDEVTTWMEDPSAKGKYLYGPVGVGKTYVAAAVSNYFAKQGKSVAFVNVPTWFNQLKSYFQASSNATSDVEKELRKVMNADFAVFDDIGAENVTAWNRDDILYPVLNYRMENGLMTWFTSNEDFTTLEQHYTTSNKGDTEKMKAVRLMERIRTLSKTVKMLGDSLRK